MLKQEYLLLEYYLILLKALSISTTFKDSGNELIGAIYFDAFQPNVCLIYFECTALTLADIFSIIPGLNVIPMEWLDGLLTLEDVLLFICPAFGGNLRFDKDLAPLFRHKPDTLAFMEGFILKIERFALLEPMFIGKLDIEKT